MLASNETLDKAAILRGRSIFQRLLRDGRRVRGRGVTLFFYLRPNSVLG